MFESNAKQQVIPFVKCQFSPFSCSGILLQQFCFFPSFFSSGRSPLGQPEITTFIIMGKPELPKMPTSG